MMPCPLCGCRSCHCAPVPSPAVQDAGGVGAKARCTYPAGFATESRAFGPPATGPGIDGASDGEDAPLPPIREPLDPGIATAVELLRSEGLATTDSGDGYSKVEAIEAGEANNHGHVFIEVCGGMTADDIIACAAAIPWTDYGYRVPTVELLVRPECIRSGDESDIVAVLWLPGMLALHPLEIRRNALVLRLLAAGFVEVPGPSEHLRRFDDADGAVLIPIGYPRDARDFENTLNHAAKQCGKVEDRRARQGTAAPTLAGVQAELERAHRALTAIGVAEGGALEDRLMALACRHADAVGEERKQANEWLAQARDSEVAMKQVRAALFSALGVEPDDTSTLRLLTIVHSHIRTVNSDYCRTERENREACHLLQLLGVKPGFLPDMIASLLPKSRLLKLRIRNETEAALRIDNLSLQEVAEDDPRMVEAIRLHREATALRRAAEPVRDHIPEGGKKVNG